MRRIILPAGVVTFPRLRELKGKHGLTYELIASVMGLNSYHSVTNKMAKCTFTLLEMALFVHYINGRGEHETIDTVFGDWIMPYIKEEPQDGV